MELLKHVCQYTGGMNKDFSTNNYPNTCYLDAQNFRIITSESTGLTDTSLSTPKGNSLSFTIPNSGVLLGYTRLRDYLIIFTKDPAGTDPDRIYKIAISDLTTAGDIILSEDYYWTAGNRHLVYKGDLGFNTSNPIKVVGNYENAYIQKVYWVDGLNNLRHINTIHNAIYNDLQTLDPELLEIVPNHVYGTYAITEGVGGNLKAGRIQYSYQLYSTVGTETMFAPPSNLYNIGTYQSSDADDFVGNELETIVNKSLNVTITLEAGIETTFNRIRLVALEYEIYRDVPTVRVLLEQPLVTNVVTFTDIGNTIGELVLEEFQIVKSDFIPKTIESKNNYLFAGNITTEYFDIDDAVNIVTSGLSTYFDSRAYRWRYAIGATMYATQQLTESTDPEAMFPPGGVPSYGADCFDCVFVYAYETSWKINITIGALAHAAGLGRTFTSIASIDNGYAAVMLHRVDPPGWEGGLTLHFNSASFSFDGTDLLTVTGTEWGVGGAPSDNPGFPSDFDDLALFNFYYTYNYSYVPGGAAVDCVVNKGLDGETVIDSGAGPDYSVVLENNNCINTYNNITNDTDVDYTHVYKYKEITAAGPPAVDKLGGTGPHISYGFTTETIPAGTIYSIPGGWAYDIIPSTTYPGYTSPVNILNYTGYQRDEVYRFGIVFYDLKGRPSYAKWIGDIRMPDMSEELSAASYSSVYEICEVDGVPANNMNIKALGVQFTVDWGAIETNYPGLLALLSGYQIVRMERTDSDSTIKAQGLIVPTHYPTVAVGEIKDTRYSSYNITSAKDYDDATIVPLEDGFANPITGGNSNIDQELVELLSPEITISKNIIIDKTNDFLEVCGYLDNVWEAGFIDGNEYVYSVTGQTITTYDPTPVLVDEWRKTITDGFISIPEGKSPTTHVVDTTEYTARGYDDNVTGDHPRMTYKGTSLVAKISAAFTNITSGGVNGEEKAMYGRYRRPMSYSIYGGATYTQRSYNSYIKASEFTVISTGAPTTITVYGGDTYIGPFSFLKLFSDIDGEYLTYSGQVGVTFPVESKINIYFRLDKFSKYLSGLTGYNYRLAEKQTIGVSQYPDYYPEVGDLYRYNSAYSAENTSKVYLSKPFDFRAVDVKDVLVTNSDPKFNGEYSDSWLKFKYNNYKELEGEQGSLVRLINSGDKLVAFQDRGIAVLSVLERELVETQNTSTLAVGTGGILSRYDYLSKKNGTSIYEAIVSTEGGIYFYDNFNNGIYRIADTLEAISDTKGLKSYYESTPYISLITAYNKRHREVLFSPPAGNTLCFSGYIDAFSGFYTFDQSGIYVTNYITFDKYLLSSTDGNIFYLHDVGNYNEYYGENQASSLTLIVNPNKTMSMTFHVIDWLTDVTVAGVDDLITTFDTLQITDTHQDTNPITLSGNDDLKRRFRTWRLNIFRDKDDGGRIRDSWIKAIFSFVSTASHKKLVVHPITFSNLPTKIWQIIYMKKFF